MREKSNLCIVWFRFYLHEVLQTEKLIMKTFSDLKGDLLLTEFRIWCPNHPSLLLRYQNDGLPCYPRIAALSFKGFIYKVSILSVLLDAVLFHQEVSYEN